MQRRVVLINLVRRARKVEDYARGAEALFASIKSSKIGERYHSFSVKSVAPPLVLEYKHERDWSHVLEIIDRRATNKPLLITKSQWLIRYPGIAKYNEKRRYKYLRHCEFALITHLTSLGRSSTEIGVSKNVLCPMPNLDRQTQREIKIKMDLRRISRPFLFMAKARSVTQRRMRIRSVERDVQENRSND